MIERDSSAAVKTWLNRFTPRENRVTVRHETSSIRCACSGKGEI
jgi:hypothetical protein